MLALRMGRPLRVLLRHCSTAAAPKASAPAEDYVTPLPSPASKAFSPRISAIVDQIAGLTLIEVSELNDALKERLNLPDVSAMPMGMPMAMAAGAAAPAAEEEVAVKKTSFKVKLVKFDDTKKIALIKEIKSSVPGFNLVQAKKFVEALPQSVVEDVGKDEAEKLKTALESAGGVCEIE